MAANVYLYPEHIFECPFCAPSMCFDQHLYLDINYVSQI